MSKYSQLLKAIGPCDLTGYFEFLDELRASNVTNMFGAMPYLMEEYPGISRQEASTVLQVWMDTFDNALPAEDRVEKALNNG